MQRPDPLSFLIEKDTYLLELSCYIHLNPVRCGIIDDPGDYTYSSCRSYFTGRFERDLIDGRSILGYFSNNPLSYRAFLYQWQQDHGHIEKDQIYGNHGILGDEDFRKKIYKEELRGGKWKDKRELPELRGLEYEISSLNVEDVKKAIKDLLQVEENELYKRKKGSIVRELYMYGLKKYTQLKLKEIGEIFGLDYSSISASISRLLKREDKEVSKYLEQFDHKIKEISNAKT